MEDYRTDFRNEFLEVVDTNEPKRTLEFFMYVAQDTGHDIIVDVDDDGNILIDENLLDFIELIGFNYIRHKDYFEIDGKEEFKNKFAILKITRRMSKYEYTEKYINFSKLIDGRSEIEK